MKGCLKIGGIIILTGFFLSIVIYTVGSNVLGGNDVEDLYELNKYIKQEYLIEDNAKIKMNDSIWNDIIEDKMYLKIDDFSTSNFYYPLALKKNEYKVIKFYLNYSEVIIIPRMILDFKEQNKKSILPKNMVVNIDGNISTLYFTGGFENDYDGGDITYYSDHILNKNQFKAFENIKKSSSVKIRIVGYESNLDFELSKKDILAIWQTIETYKSAASYDID